MRHANISIFIPHLGCPFNCIFCDQYKITGSDKAVTPRDVYEILLNAKDSVDSNNTQIAFFGGSFTAIDRKLMTEYLSVAYKFIESGDFESIRISTRPDCINDEIATTLKKYGVKTVELGVQSLDDEVLIASKRGHTALQSLEAVKLLHLYGFEVGMQMMCGLPCDTREKDIETAKKIIESGCKQVRIYPVVVIDGTHLAKMYKNGEYAPLTVEKAVDICAILYKMFADANVKILKMGLHSDSESIAGPFHPSFGELVRSRVFFNEITEKISPKEYANIKCAQRFISIAKGNKSDNALKLKQLGYNIDFTVDKTIENGYIIEKQTV